MNAAPPKAPAPKKAAPVKAAAKPAAKAAPKPTSKPAPKAAKVKKAKQVSPTPVVLQIIPALETGGAETGTVQMAAALMAAGAKAVVVSSGGRLSSLVRRSGALYLEWRDAPSKNPLIILKNALRLALVCRREGVTIIHARSRAPAWSALIASMLCGARYMTTFHAPYKAKKGWLGGPKRLYNSVMARGARVIAISDFVARHIALEYPWASRNIRTVPRGIDMVAFTPSAVTPARLSAVLDKMGPAGGVPLIVLPARLTRWKGQAFLIKALAALEAAGGTKNYEAWLVGDAQGRDGYRAELEDLIETSGLKGRVKMPGPCHDMPALYKLADLVVSPALEPEGFGRVIVEAQAMGKPVIVSNCGAVAETVQANVSGWVVEPGDIAALAALIHRAMTMTVEERTAMGEAGREFVASRYGMDVMMKKTLAVYQELLPPGKRFENL